jgi:hypothetical protein
MTTQARAIGHVPERDDLILRSFNDTWGYLKFPKKFADKFPELNVETITSPGVIIKQSGGYVRVIYSWLKTAMVSTPSNISDFEAQPDMIQRNPNLRLGYLRLPKNFIAKVKIGKHTVPSPGFRIEEKDGFVLLIFFWKVKDLLGKTED